MELKSFVVLVLFVLLLLKGFHGLIEYTYILCFLLVLNIFPERIKKKPLKMDFLVGSFIIN